MLNPPFVPRFVRCGRWQGTVARGGELYYPIWLAYATGVLEQEYDDIRLVDAIACNWDEEYLLKDATNFNPDLAVIDSNFSSMSNDVNIAKLLKEAVPGATTVLVGPPASQFADRILQSGGVDIVARFEYDFTIRDIARSLGNGDGFENIKGISFRKNDKIIHNPDREFTTSQDLDQIPFVSKIYKKYLHIEDYFLSQSLYPEVQIFTSRGCHYQCTFCSWPETLMGRIYRMRSVNNVVDEFEYIMKELTQVKEVFIDDDTFTIDKKRIRAICREIKRRKLKITWSCNARADLDYETMREMKSAGCRLLDVGYESGSNEILKNIKKGISTERMYQFAEDARRAGLMVLGDFVFGFPGETKKTAEETMRFAKELRPNIAQFAVSVPLPGTEFYRWAEENDFLLTNELDKSVDGNGFQKCIVSYPEFTNKDVERYVDRALKKYYLSPSYIPIAFKNILRRNGWHELKGMVRSAKALFGYLGRGNRAN